MSGVHRSWRRWLRHITHGPFVYDCHRLFGQHMNICAQNVVDLEELVGDVYMLVVCRDCGYWWFR